MKASSISVVIPARNAARYLDECLDSVRHQTVRPLEAIVIDDGSEDATPEVLASRSGEVRVLERHGDGAAAARNAGLAEARGDWIAFLDADDRWEADKLERQLAHARESPEARLLFTDARVVEPGGIRKSTYLEGRRPDRISREALLLDNFVCTSSVLAERSLLLELQGFREHLAVAQDYDLWLRLLARAPAAYLDEPLVLYRVRPESLSNDRATNIRETLTALRSSLDGLSFSDAAALRRRIFPLEYTLGHLRLEAGDLVGATAAFAGALRTRPWSPLAMAFYLACRGGARVAFPLKAAISVARLLVQGKEPEY